jgi:amidase
MAQQTTADLTAASATELAQLIREKRASSREVVEAHLRRIDAVNERLNAVVQLTADSALDAARAADEALARGDALGPLHGVPFTVKDWLETNDAVCAAGMPERRDYVPKRDATVVARIREAGAVMLGKTLDGEKNDVYGLGANPYDLSRSPGGSSSGEAAIIAAGGSPLGLGSDSGGSIRYPAHCCGVAGLKPTTGRVPLTGHFPRIGALSDPRTQIGPLARTVDDLALALRIIAGPDGHDPSVAPVPLGDLDGVTLAGLRVAHYAQYEGASATRETVEAVGAAVVALTDAGAAAEEALPPRIGEAFDITKSYWRRTRSAAWNDWAAGRESKLSGDDIERSIFAWERLQRAFLGFMSSFDVIVCPVAGRPAPARGGVEETAFVHTVPYSLTGWPVAVVRAGTSPEALPIGVQVVAARWRDDVALAAARRIEAALGPWPAPDLA